MTWRSIYRIEANGIDEAGDAVEGVAHAVWPRHGAQVASQQSLILRGGGGRLATDAVGHKAQNLGGWGQSPKAYRQGFPSLPACKKKRTHGARFAG